MKRRLLNFLTALSLLLCVAVCVLWVRSYRPAPAQEDQFSVYVPAHHARYTLRSERGGLVLFAPPALRPSMPPAPQPELPANWGMSDARERSGIVPLPASATAAGAVAAIANDQLDWDICRRHEPLPADTQYRPYFSPRGGRGTPVQSLVPWDPLDEFEEPYPFQETNPLRYRPFPSGALNPHLLAALEDPDRWVAAHVLLTRLNTSPFGEYDSRFGRPLTDPRIRTFNSLRAVLRPTGRAYDWSDDASDGYVYEVVPCVASAHPAQRPAIRDHWHRNLDVVRVAVPHWHVAVATLALPTMLWSTVGVGLLRLRALRRGGLCPKCGYDLRATPGRCPECGTPGVAAAAG